jgi:CheY-like chemotaxis protein/predicted regulator of Ras-like GTPase activity (Roadblock/LC7/MglB family)
MSKVLIVDDEKSFLESLVDGLSEYKDLEITTAHSGKEAVEKLNGDTYEVVVTDLKMPEMGGYELVAYMAGNFSDVPIVVMTAFGTPEMEENLRVLGISYYLEKPIDYEDLAKKVLHILKERQSAGSAKNRKAKSAKQVLDSIQEVVNSEQGGEVVVKSGQNNGRIFISKGKIAWVMASTIKNTFFSYLEQNTDLQFEDLKAVFEECKRSGANFGEQIIEWQLLDRAALRSHLFDFISFSLGEIMGWPESESVFVAESRVYKSELTFPLQELVAKLKLSGSAAKPAGKSSAAKKAVKNKNDGESLSRASKEILRELTFIDGFRDVAVFSAEGDLIGGVYKNSKRMSEIGKIANELLLASQKATETMGVGRGNLIQITSETDEILIYCINENTDYTETEEGKAHFHSMLIFEINSALGLAKIQFEKVVPKLAEIFRG